MAVRIVQETTGSVGQGRFHRAKALLATGILGGALMFGFGLGITNEEGSASRAAAGAATATEVPAAVIRASSAPSTYRVSAPNETDPDGTLVGNSAPPSYAPYRLSPPNEQNPEGP
jgi:hypothetical protein